MRNFRDQERGFSAKQNEQFRRAHRGDPSSLFLQNEYFPAGRGVASVISTVNILRSAVSLALYL
jgi:hypothetical protein